MTKLALHSNAAIHGFGDPLGDDEAKARAFHLAALILKTLEGDKEASQPFRRNSQSRIRHVQPQPVRGHPLEADEDLPVLPVVFDGVG